MEYAIDCEWNRKRQLLCFTYAFINDSSELVVKTLTDYFEIDKFIDNTINDLWIGHNIKSDLLIIMENIGKIHYNIFDTMIAAQQLTNGMEYAQEKGFYTYGNLVKRICNVELDKSEQKNFLDREDNYFTPIQIKYIENDVKYLFSVYQKLKNQLIKANMLDKCFKIDMQAIPVLVKIEFNGMLIDVPKWRQLVENWNIRSEDLLNNIITILTNLGYDCTIKTSTMKGRGKEKKEVIVETPVNFNSWQQIQKIFKFFNVPLPVDKHEKESTNKDLLATYNAQNPDNLLKDFIKVFIDYKKTNKLISSFGQRLLDDLNNGKSLHTEYSVAFTTTGRLSSKSNNIRPYTTNVQNIPAKTQDGKDIMSCIIAEEGYKIVCADMSGAELRIVGSLSKDQLVMDSFNKGVDFHSELATCSWEVICKNKGMEYSPINKKNNPKWIDADFRTIHKGVNFGLLYGASAKRIAEVLQIPLSWAGDCKKSIEKKVPVLMGYLKSQQEFAKKNKYLRSPFTNRVRHNLSMTEASNWQIQCANAEAMKIALYEIDKHIVDNSIDAKIINTVHDSVVVMINDKHIENNEHLFIKDIMANCLGQFLEGINGESDLSIAAYWSK